MFFVQYTRVYDKLRDENLHMLGKVDLQVKHIQIMCILYWWQANSRWIGEQWIYTNRRTNTENLCFFTVFIKLNNKTIQRSLENLQDSLLSPDVILIAYAMPISTMGTRKRQDILLGDIIWKEVIEKHTYWKQEKRRD